MRSTTDIRHVEPRAPWAIWSITVLLILSGAAGCASTAKAKSEVDHAPTIERLLTAPLTGMEGRNSIQFAMMKLYGIASADSKRIDNQPKTLQDRHVLSVFWLEPAPADFMSMAVAAEPCFPTARAPDHRSQAAHPRSVDRRTDLRCDSKRSDGELQNHARREVRFLHPYRLRSINLATGYSPRPMRRLTSQRSSMGEHELDATRESACGIDKAYRST